MKRTLIIILAIVALVALMIAMLLPVVPEQTDEPEGTPAPVLTPDEVTELWKE